MLPALPSLLKLRTKEIVGCTKSTMNPSLCSRLSFALRLFSLCRTPSFTVSSLMMASILYLAFHPEAHSHCPQCQFPVSSWTCTLNMLISVPHPLLSTYSSYFYLLLIPSFDTISLYKTIFMHQFPLLFHFNFLSLNLVSGTVWNLKGKFILHSSIDECNEF